MQIHIYKDYQTLSQYAAEEILLTVKNKPAAVLCLATGHTPQLAYALLAKKAMDEKIDFTRCTFIGLDEWVNISPQNEGSCRFYLQSKVFGPLNISASQVFLFNGMSANLAEECEKANRAIDSKGGVDLMLAGVGMNGHIGFNEPGVSIDLYAHVIQLDEITQTIGQKYFTDTAIIKQGITLGFKQILQSKKLLMMASGSKKAAVMQQAMEGPVSNQIPASITRMHPQAFAMIDEDAAALLNLKDLPPEILAGLF